MNQQLPVRGNDVVLRKLAINTGQSGVNVGTELKGRLKNNFKIHDNVQLVGGGNTSEVIAIGASDKFQKHAIIEWNNLISFHHGSTTKFL